MPIYKIRVRGSIYGEYDGDVLVESSERIPEFNKDLLIEYHGKLKMMDLIMFYLNPQIPQYIAYKTAGMKFPMEYYIDNGKYISKSFDSQLRESIDHLKKQTIKIRKNEIDCLSLQDKKEDWECISSIEDIEWNIKKRKPTIDDIRNGVTIFIYKETYSFIVFTECGISIEKTLSENDRLNILKKAGIC